MTARTLNRVLLAGVTPAFAAAAMILTDPPARIPAMAAFLGYLALTAATAVSANHPGAGRRLLHTARATIRAAAILATPPLTVRVIVRTLTTPRPPRAPRTQAPPLTRALTTLAIIGFLTVIAIRVLDKPAWTWALIAFLGFVALTVFTVAALEGGDTVTEPQHCLSPDAFGADQPAATHVNTEEGA